MFRRIFGKQLEIEGVKMGMNNLDDKIDILVRNALEKEADGCEASGGLKERIDQRIKEENEPKTK